jgi:hypothetical protein
MPRELLTSVARKRPGGDLQVMDSSLGCHAAGCRFRRVHRRLAARAFDLRHEPQVGFPLRGVASRRAPREEVCTVGMAHPRRYRIQRYDGSIHVLRSILSGWQNRPAATAGGRRRERVQAWVFAEGSASGARPHELVRHSAQVSCSASQRRARSPGRKQYSPPRVTTKLGMFCRRRRMGCSGMVTVPVPS